MAHADRFELELTNQTGPRALLLDVECSSGEPRLLKERVDPGIDATGGDHTRAPGRVELVAQVVAQGHQVDEMIRVQMADGFP